MVQNLQLVLISTGVFVLTGLAATWVWKVWLRMRLQTMRG